MIDTTPTYALPRWAPIRWLAKPGADVPPEIAATIVGDLFSSGVPLVAGGIANSTITVIAAIRHPGPVFYVVLGIELVLLVGRLLLLKASRRIAARGGRTPTDLFLASSMAWAVLVGLDTALCVATRDPVLQMLAPTQMMGMLVGLVSRNHGMPRLAITQIVLCDLPLKLVIPFCGEPWLLMSCAYFPMFILALVSSIQRLNRNYFSAVLAKRESEVRATHDMLTGLRNRSGFMMVLGRALQCRDEGFASSLLYIDLDGFKVVNDTHGHGAGDDLLRQVAGRISASVPDAALTARFGGDEFVILLPGADAAEAEKVGLRVIAALSRPYDLDQMVQARVGASVGIACAKVGSTPEALLAEADAALYRSKAAGKGRCVLAAQTSLSVEPAACAA